MIHIVFVHGWSVTNTDTYGQLPLYLQQQAAAGKLDAQVSDVFLGKYVSFEDTVTVDDLARAFDSAMRNHPSLAALFTSTRAKDSLAVITHSTGGPVVRQWVDRFYGAKMGKCPMTHLIMLAPANHGSALAQLGKGRLSRMKSFFNGVEPGQRVLDWLELGSDQSWALNERWLDYDPVAGELFPFVLTGQTIDRSMYDVLNSYTDEVGSDGVVRVAAANMNYSLIRLRQKGDALELEQVTRSPQTALAILPGLSHSGDDIGIIRSVTLENAATHATVKAVLRCLKVSSASDYAKVVDEFTKLSDKTQADEHRRKTRFGPFSRTYETPRCSMLIFRIRDDAGQDIADYDLVFFAGSEKDPNHLPRGFFVDRQCNSKNRGKLTYYLNNDILCAGLEDKLDDILGLDVKARPSSGLSHYISARYEGDEQEISQAVAPNETLMIDIILHRSIDQQTFTISANLTTPEKISAVPVGQEVP